MFRYLLLYLSEAGWAQAVVRDWGIARRTARRFVAGEDLKDAIRVSQQLKRHGLTTTLANLGENVTTREQADQARLELLKLMQAIGSQSPSATASIKLTQLGLGVDFDLGMQNMLDVAREAAAHGVFIRIDMEDSSRIDQTLSIHRSLSMQGLKNIGLVFQSALRRSARDVRSVVEEGYAVRIVKGAYQEPATIAFSKKADVDQNFDALTTLVIDAARKHELNQSPPMAAIATHDTRRIEFAAQYARSAGLPKAALEFQLLYGIRPKLQQTLRERSYPVRVYVPYGTQWYPYLVRRLAERPANLWFFLSNLFRR